MAARTPGQIIVDFMNIARNSPGVLAAFFNDQDNLKKATPHSDGAEHPVRELWHDYHRSPTKDELRVGRGVAASGRYASEMVREYSNTARQHGVTLDPVPLDEMLSHFLSLPKAA